MPAFPFPKTSVTLQRSEHGFTNTREEQTIVIYKDVLQNVTTHYCCDSKMGEMTCYNMSQRTIAVALKGGKLADSEKLLAYSSHTL